MVNVGDRARVVVLKYDPERGRVSLGMKQIMPDPWASVAERYPIGARVHGKVVSLADYGAFVELEPGIEGLVHVSEMSWTQARHASVEGARGRRRRSTSWCSTSTPANRRISLGLKQAEPNPWEMVRINHPVGSHIKGTVKNLTDFGVFVGVEEGIDGLVHISDLHWTKKVRHPSELFQKGDEVEAVVLGIDVDNERISLGVKQLAEDPWSEHAARASGRHARARQGHQRHRLRRVHGGRGGHRGPHPRLAAQHRTASTSRRRCSSPGQEVEAEVTAVDARDRKIALSIKALRKSEEREEIETYLQQRARGRPLLLRGHPALRSAPRSRRAEPGRR